ncbi:MAG: DUF3603 family protein [Bacilli bacterium]
MTYIYDILLNLNKDLIEFFEWEDSDNIKYVKKIAVFKTSSKIIKDIIFNEVIFDSNFTKIIPKYEMNGMKSAGSLCLLTDGLMVIGLLIKESKPILISRLLLDEEFEVLELADSLENTNINYKIVNSKPKERNSLTRKEKEIKEKLSLEIDKLYEMNNGEKLIYLYYEFTNLECSNTDYIYKYLKDSLKNFSDKHRKLYDILLLSNTKLK